MPRFYILILFSILLITGCSTRGNPSLNKKTKILQTKNSNNYITNALYKEYEKWNSTKYRFGGEDFNGIDCSSLIQTIYKNGFSIKLPRTTKEQVKKGYKVSRNNLRDGDLVFFKTGYNTRHAGIVIEKYKFIHASQKNGVTISSLHNPYWKSKYWQARRLLP